MFSKLAFFLALILLVFATPSTTAIWCWKFASIQNSCQILSQKKWMSFLFFWFYYSLGCIWAREQILHVLYCITFPAFYSYCMDDISLIMRCTVHSPTVWHEMDWPDSQQFWKSSTYRIGSGWTFLEAVLETFRPILSFLCFFIIFNWFYIFYFIMFIFIFLHFCLMFGFLFTYLFFLFSHAFVNKVKAFLIWHEYFQ